MIGCERLHRGALLLGVVLWLTALGAGASTPPRAYLVTMEPGGAYWERFGHNALVLDDGSPGGARSYNFGYFDFDQPGFLRRFLVGEMRYRAVVLPARDDLERYLAAGRRVWLQELDLDPAQFERLRSHLEWHVQPEQSEYRYDYFRNNCSTKVRDALDHALDGALRRATGHRSHGYTYRWLALAHARTTPWMYLGIHFGLGPQADRNLSLWEEFFIPSLLLQGVREVQLVNAAGQPRPLVRSERELLDGALDPHVPVAPAWGGWFLLAGLVLALIVHVLGRRPETQALLGSVLAFGLGALGLGLFGLGLGTEHWAAWHNHNVWLANPVWWATVPGWWRLWRRGRPGPAFGIGTALAFGIAGCGVFLKTLPMFPQVNLDWVLLLLPVQGVMYALARRRSGSEAPRPA